MWSGGLIDYLETEASTTDSNFSPVESTHDYSPYSEPLDDHILPNIGHQNPYQAGELMFESPSDIFEQYWMSYLNPIEQTNPIFHAPPSQPEFYGFWADQDCVEPSWLTQISTIPEPDVRLYHQVGSSTSADFDHG